MPQRISPENYFAKPLVIEQIKTIDEIKSLNKIGEIPPIRLLTHTGDNHIIPLIILGIVTIFGIVAIVALMKK